MNPNMPSIDSELNRDVFAPSWASGEASVQRLDGTTGGEEYVRRRNYIPAEQQRLMATPSTIDMIRALLEQQRHYESLPGVGHWSSGNPSVRLIDTDPAYGPPEALPPQIPAIDAMLNKQVFD